MLLVHGLARTTLSLKGLGRAIRREGFSVESFGYAGWLQSYGSMVNRMVRRLERLAAAGPYAIVGHSFGGLLARAALAHFESPSPKLLVMLGTPNQRPYLATRAVQSRLWRLLTGDVGRKLASQRFYESLPPLEVPYTIIAGTRDPLQQRGPLGSAPNDGLVAVEETRIRPKDTVIEFPVIHSFMMNNRDVQRAIIHALRQHARDD